MLPNEIWFKIAEYLPAEYVETGRVGKIRTFRYMEGLDKLIHVGLVKGEMHGVKVKQFDGRTMKVAREKYLDDYGRWTYGGGGRYCE